MMDLGNNTGREIESIEFDPEGIRLFKTNEKAYLSCEYYGDHGENWVVVDVEGKEIQRFNTKYISIINWK